MVSEVHRSFMVSDRSYLAVIKKDIHQIAVHAGFAPARAALIDIVIAEIGSNFIKHATSGELLVRAIPGECIDIIGIDNGPGMEDAAAMMGDGVSTTNTLGGGLGAIHRLSDRCQIYSRPGWGTIVYSRIMVKKQREPRAAPSGPLLLYDLLVPYPGEEVCGDGFALLQHKAGQLLFLGDGLGHGKPAHDAVKAAIGALKVSTETTPVGLLRYLHICVNKTRGLVGTVAVYQPAARQWLLSGVGNISTTTHGGMRNKTYLSYNGIIGHSIPRTMTEQRVELLRGQYIIFCSDGIKSRWDASKYPAIFKYDPCILAAALYKDYARRTDDISIVIVRMI